MDKNKNSDTGTEKTEGRFEEYFEDILDVKDELYFYSDKMFYLLVALKAFSAFDMTCIGFPINDVTKLRQYIEFVINSPKEEVKDELLKSFEKFKLEMTELTDKTDPIMAGKNEAFIKLFNDEIVKLTEGKLA